MSAFDPLRTLARSPIIDVMKRLIPVAVLVAMLVACKPFTYRGTERGIAIRLLHNVPPGTSRKAFLMEARRRGWKVEGSWEGNKPDEHTNWGGIDGAHVVWVYLGGYSLILRTDIDSFWAFDEHDRLKGVAVRKMVDAP
jgi:hypothetical protein